MARRTGLGRGLDAFFNSDAEPEKEKAERQDMAAKNTAGKAKNTSGKTGTAKKNAAEKTAEPQMVNIALVDTDGDQPRKSFNTEELVSMAETIKTYGILQPLLVEKKGERYVIVAGERRFRAAKLAGLKKVPVRIDTYTPQKRMEISLIENIQRSDLNPIEEAKAYQTLIESFGLRQEDVAQRVAKNRATVTNSLRLLKLDDRVQTMLIDNTLSSGHARALLSLPDKEQQFSVAEKIAEKGLSVRDTEKLVKKLLEEPAGGEEKKPDPQEDRLSVFYRDLEEQLKSVMGTKVQIRRRDENKGRIEIEYYSSEELERITELLQSLRA